MKTPCLAKKITGGHKDPPLQFITVLHFSAITKITNIII